MELWSSLLLKSFLFNGTWDRPSEEPKASSSREADKLLGGFCPSPAPLGDKP